jgi:hypothetical protein
VPSLGRALIDFSDDARDLAAPELRCGNFGLDRIDPHRKLSASEVDRMAKRNPILNARAENQVIGYIEGTEAFDLMGNKRCNYTPSTGNLVEPDSRRIIGHVSLGGYFVGESWIADELFAGRVAKNAPIPLHAQSDAAASQVPTSSLREPTTDRAESLATTKEVTETPLSIDAQRALEMIRVTLGTKSIDQLGD